MAARSSTDEARASEERRRGDRELHVRVAKPKKRPQSRYALYFAKKQRQMEEIQKELQQEVAAKKKAKEKGKGPKGKSKVPAAPGVPAASEEGEKGDWRDALYFATKQRQLEQIQKQLHQEVAAKKKGKGKGKGPKGKTKVPDAPGVPAASDR